MPHLSVYFFFLVKSCWSVRWELIFTGNIQTPFSFSPLNAHLRRCWKSLDTSWRLLRPTRATARFSRFACGAAAPASLCSPGRAGPGDPTARQHWHLAGARSNRAARTAQRGCFPRVGQEPTCPEWQRPGAGDGRRDGAEHPGCSRWGARGGGRILPLLTQPFPALSLSACSLFPWRTCGFPKRKCRLR